MEALVLKVNHYLPATSLVTMLTPDYGLVKSFFRNSKKYTQSRANFQIGQLLELEIECFDADKRILSIKGFSIKKNFIFKNDLYGHWILHNYWAEVLVKTEQDIALAKDLFLMSQQIFYFSGSLLNFGNMLLPTLLNYLKDVGYQLEYSKCLKCDKSTYQTNNGGEINYRKQIYQIVANEQGFLCQDCHYHEYNFFNYQAWIIKYLLLTQQGKAVKLGFKHQKLVFSLLNHCMGIYFNLKLTSWRSVNNLYEQLKIS
ncbi:MAG: recombination protein O N-terminal domain-containing protein [SAR324 cluster bacterium]|nr:recombination protein O N-terminal domain-containing protein [SAR324 cluster bacterium]